MTHFGKCPSSVPGFLFSGIYCGIKTDPRKKDMALIVSEEENTAVAGVFTKNAFAAGPVLLCRRGLKRGRGRGRAIVINSGNANAGLGAQSERDAAQMQAWVADALNFHHHEIFVSSTGKIGVPLPMGKVELGITQAVRALSPKGFRDAAEAITTTDKAIKVGYVRGEIGGKPYTLAAMAKGAGMIEPNMATMLCYVLTDLAVEPSFLQTALKQAVDGSLNAVSVDGDQSTNDSVIALANGRAGNTPIRSGKNGDRFITELQSLLRYLGREIVLDGEGATKCLEINVTGAKSIQQARTIARAIGNSQLVKCAFYGGDPNWGRILSAAGAADPTIKADRVSLAIAGTTVVSGGERAAYSESALAKTLKKSRDIAITLDLQSGRSTATFLASDLTEEYVRFNSAYST